MMQLAPQPAVTRAFGASLLTTFACPTGGDKRDVAPRTLGDMCAPWGCM